VAPLSGDRASGSVDRAEGDSGVLGPDLGVLGASERRPERVVALRLLAALIWHGTEQKVFLRGPALMAEPQLGHALTGVVPSVGI
jgi:hypothetical protein